MDVFLLNTFWKYVQQKIIQMKHCWKAVLTVQPFPTTVFFLNYSPFVLISLFVHFIWMFLVSSSLVPTCDIKCIAFLRWNGLDYGVRGDETYICYTCIISHMWQRIRHCSMLGFIHTMHILVGGGVKKTTMLAVYISVCVQKKNQSQLDVFPSVASDDCLTLSVPSDPLTMSVRTSRCLYSWNHRSLSFSEGVNVTRVLWRVHSVYFLQRLNVYIVWKHVSVDKKKSY